MNLSVRAHILVALPVSLTCVLAGCRSSDVRRSGVDAERLGNIIFSRASYQPGVEFGGETAAVVLDPSAALSCNTSLPEWFTWQSQAERRLVLVLTREPTANERRELKMLRLHVAGVVPAGATVAARPRVYLFSARSLIDSVDLAEGPTSTLKLGGSVIADRGPQS